MTEKTEWAFGALPCESNATGDVVRPFTIEGKVIFRFNINATVVNDEKDDNEDQVKALCEAIQARTRINVDPKRIIELVRKGKITMLDHVV